MTSTPPEPQIALVSPVRNEARTLERTIECVRSQSVVPAIWLVVDDGSSDATPQILEAAAKEIPWLRVLRREDRGFRRVGPGVIEAFEAGLAAIDVPYDYIAKLDADLEFGPRYLEVALEHFDRNPKLAAISGKVFRPEKDRMVEEFMIDEMVAGQFKLYRRSAYETIGGFVREVMWDGVDFHLARMAGYHTASVDDPRLRITHLRLMGSSEGTVLRGRLRHGRGQWFMGTSLSYMVASGLFRAREKPFVIGGLLMIAGYLGAALRREPRYGDDTFRSDLRAWQRNRLRNLLTRGRVR